MSINLYLNVLPNLVTVLVFNFPSLTTYYFTQLYICWKHKHFMIINQVLKVIFLWFQSGFNKVYTHELETLLTLGSLSCTE